MDEEESAFRSCFSGIATGSSIPAPFAASSTRRRSLWRTRAITIRTRLTHSIEVAQVARTISGALGLNADLTEAVALAHDLGHTPFGHTGEDALAALMTPYGGFDHNAQALRIVTKLERHYADFDGLNLTWETLEGLAKHNGPVTGELPSPGGMRRGARAGACQPCQRRGAGRRLADDIAYNNHDLHDGLRAGLFGETRSRGCPSSALLRRGGCALSGPRRLAPPLRGAAPGLWRDGRRRDRRERQAALTEAAPRSAEEVRGLGAPVIRFSPECGRICGEIRSFLYNACIARRRQRDARMVARVIEDLFPVYIAASHHLPDEWRAMCAAPDRAALARLVGDYIAGMTDRFALQSHARLVGRRDGDGFARGSIGHGH